MLEAKQKGFVTYDPSLDGLRQWVALSIPFVALIVAILFFAWLMGRKVSQPVNELLLSVSLGYRCR
jgi:hypothetical protein